jgi:PAS domain S-box-containing protein
MESFDLENLFENVPDSVSIIDRKYRILLVNRTFRKWLRSLNIDEEIGGKTVFKAFPFLPKRVKEEYDKVFRTGKIVVTEEKTKPNGSVIVTETRKVPVKKNGKVVHIITIVRDITKRRAAEEEFKEGKEKYESLFNKSNDPIFIHDMKGNMIDVNQRAIELFGYSKKEMLLMKIKDLHPHEALKKSKWAFMVIAKKGFVNFQVDFKKKGGRIFPGEVSASVFKIRGKKVIQGIVRDVTEKEFAKQALHESRRKYRLIFELCPAVVVLIDREGVIQEINREILHLLGYRPREIIGRNLRELKFFPKASKAKITKNFSKRMRGQRAEPYDIECIAKDGKVKIGRLVANVLKDDHGRIIGEVGIISDMTDIKAAEKKLRKACMLKGFNP